PTAVARIKGTGVGRGPGIGELIWGEISAVRENSWRECSWIDCYCQRCIRKSRAQIMISGGCDGDYMRRRVPERICNSLRIGRGDIPEEIIALHKTGLAVVKLYPGLTLLGLVALDHTSDCWHFAITRSGPSPTKPNSDGSHFTRTTHDSSAISAEGEEQPRRALNATILSDAIIS